MTIVDGSTQNLLVKQLSAATKARYKHEIKKIWLDSGQRIIESQTKIAQVFFPLDCVISRRYTAACAHSTQMGMVGFEGVAGFSVFLGSAYDAVAHIAGEALALNANSAEAMFREDLKFQRAVLRYIRFMVRQISQVAVCNSLHTIEQRLSRCLLLTSEKARSNNLCLTHEAIAKLLAARRESITGALGYPQSSGIIRTHRGRIEIVNASSLAAASCECYRVIRAEFDECFRDQASINC